MREYLKDIPREAAETGISKVLLVRREVIHLKHILTEIFHRESFDFDKILEYVGMSYKDYLFHITTKLRRVHRISRTYNTDPNEIVNYDYKSMFKFIDLVASHDKTLIILDFDGVITSKKFHPLYSMCLEKARTVVCTANPEVTFNRFDKIDLPIPDKIYACKGGKKKMRTIIDLAKRSDFVFYVDDEPKYLDIAWAFGIHTFIYKDGKIKHYGLNTK